MDNLGFCLSRVLVQQEKLVRDPTYRNHCEIVHQQDFSDQCD
jgi:hypothetical protein